jgi:hypothetical protein
MRYEDYREQELQLAAGRLGLKLVRSKGRGPDVYSLRALRQATRVLCKLPDGGYGLVYADGARWKRASWMRLAEIAQVLAQWRGHVPKAWGEPSPRRGRSPQVANPIAAGPSVPSSGGRYRQLDLTRSPTTSCASNAPAYPHCLAAKGVVSVPKPCV